jgi:hypothetical protein
LSAGVRNMPELSLSDQSTLTATIQPKIVQLRNAMDLRLPVWNRLSVAKKKAWIVSGKDPIMTLAWQVYRYLRDNFFGENVDD